MDEKNKTSGNDYDWEKICIEYVTKKITYQELCDKYGCSMSCLSKRATAEKWVEQRKKHRKKIAKKSEEKAADRAAEKNIRDLTRCYKLANELLNKLEKAIKELDKHVLITKKIIKTEKDGKETTEQIEKIRTVKSLVKTEDLKRIADSLRSAKDVLRTDDNTADNNVTIIFDSEELKNYGA